MRPTDHGHHGFFTKIGARMENGIAFEGSDGKRPASSDKTGGPK